MRTDSARLTDCRAGRLVSSSRHRFGWTCCDATTCVDGAGRHAGLRAACAHVQRTRQPPSVCLHNRNAVHLVARNALAMPSPESSSGLVACRLFQRVPTTMTTTTTTKRAAALRQFGRRRVPSLTGGRTTLDTHHSTAVASSPTPTTATTTTTGRKKLCAIGSNSNSKSSRNGGVTSGAHLTMARCCPGLI